MAMHPAFNRDQVGSIPTASKCCTNMVDAAFLPGGASCLD